MDPTSADSLLPLFHSAWQEAARRDAPALIGEEREISYSRLFQEVGGLSGRLRAAGVGRGARVALAMERSLDLPVTLLALLAAGACPCVLEPKLGREEVERRLSMTRIDWLLLDSAHERDEALSGLSGPRRLPLAGLPDAAPHWDLDIEPEAPALLLFTSGSSGKPKGVLLSHRGLLVNALGVAERTELSPSDRLLHIMPLFHTNGVNNQILAPLLAGASVALSGRFRAEEMPALLLRHRPTILTGVPTIYSRMLGVAFPEGAFSSVRMLRCGSAPITEELHQRVEEAFGKPLVLSYGLSEATCTSTMNPPERRKVGSVGQGVARQSVFLADAGGNPIAEPGRDGEVCISGPSLMLGYIEEGSGGEPSPPGPVLHSGDLGRFDEEGYLTITGRIKEVIIRGGENIAPGLIESVLSKVAGVQSVCVVGRADPDLGEVPFAFLVRSADAAGEALEEAGLNAAVEEALSRIHKPAGYGFLDSLPENAVGKVDRKALARRLFEEGP